MKDVIGTTFKKSLVEMLDRQNVKIYIPATSNVMPTIKAVFLQNIRI